jgi:hypothetical protein
MAQIRSSRGRKASNAGPFFDLLDQMDALLTATDLDWPEELKDGSQ